MKIKANFEKRKCVLFLTGGTIQFLISFFWDKIVYLQQGAGGEVPYNHLWLWGCKVMAALLVGVILVFFSDFKDNKEKQSICKHIVGMLLPMIMILILIWPGVWRWDEFHILDGLWQGEIFYWQHWLTTMYYCLCLQLCPLVGGIVLAQTVLAAILGGSSVYKLRVLLKKEKKSLWLYVIFFVPAVLDNTFYPLRGGITAYIELWMVCNILYLYYQKKQNMEYRYDKTLLLSVVAALAACWRPENIIYVLIFPLLFIVLFRKEKVKILISFVISIIMMILIIGIQNHGLEQQLYANEDGYIINDRDRYEFTGFVQPLSEMYQRNFTSKNKEEDLKVISEVIDPKHMKERGGIAAFWEGGLRNLSTDNYKKIKKVYYRMVVNNIPMFLEGRWEFFLSTNGPMASTELYSSSHIYDDKLMETKLPQEAKNAYLKFRTKYYFNQPINKKLRSSIINFWECKDESDLDCSSKFSCIIWKNVLWVVMLLVGCTVISLSKGKIFMGLVNGMILGKCVLIILTAPATYFMYYFSTYMIGGVLITFSLLYKNKDV